jgi:predicted AlkP superfamily phosphohydrolase/phosphomutase
MGKVLVIGLDGATWDLLLPLAEEGFLPNLASLMEGGTCGELESTLPPVTGPAWVSFATGRNPGKTGVYDFLRPRSSLSDLVPVTSKDIHGSTFYEILRDHGRKTVLINLPLSYPPRTTDPTITSIMTQGDEFIFPDSLKEQIPALERYRIVPNFDLVVQGRDDEYIEDIRELECQRFTVAQELFDWEWDVFFVLFSGTDWVQHRFFDKLMGGAFDRSHAAFQIYRDIDSCLGWFANRLPNDASLLLMSDHGFRVYGGFLHLNQWLRGKNLLTTRHVKRTSATSPHRFAEGLTEAAKEEDDSRLGSGLSLTAPEALMDLLGKVGAGRAYKRIKKYLPMQVNTQVAVDHARSAAVCTTSESSGIYLNSAGRFQDGILEPADVRQMKEEVIGGLRNLRHPTTDEALLDEVFDGEEAYWGQQKKFAPDIVVTPRDFLVRPGSLSARTRTHLVEEVTVNDHSRYGIFLVYGPGIKKGGRVEGARIMDIAPTILHGVGLPIPRAMDGRVLEEVLERGSEPALRPVRYAASDEREQVKRRLGDLKRSKSI